MKIIYEDNHLIAAIKPAGVLSQADGTHKDDMLTVLKEYLRKKYNKPGNVFLGLVHRLDCPVSGVMIFAKTSKAASRSSEQIRQRRVVKRYLAVVHGKLENSEGVLVNKLIKGQGNIVSEDVDGKESILEYKVLSYDKLRDVSLVDVLLKTGRSHQIRVQFALSGHPLAGDMKYGARTVGNYRATEKENSIALFAYYLEFDHPVSLERIILQEDPDSRIFSDFRRNVNE